MQGVAFIASNQLELLSVRASPELREQDNLRTFVS